MIKFSTLSKTWLFDIDGTIVVHNGYKSGGDKLLDGVKEFFNNLPKDDVVIFLTARDEIYKEITERFLVQEGIRFNKIIYGLPLGERVLINDNKPSGLIMGHVINKKRDAALKVDYIIDKNL